MKMEGNAAAVSQEDGVKIEVEDATSADVVIPSNVVIPEPSGNGSDLQQHTESQKNPGHKRKKPPEDLSGKKPRETNVNNDDSDEDSDSGENCMIISKVSKLIEVDKVLKECDIIPSSNEKIGKHQVKLTFSKPEDLLKLQQKLNERGLNWKEGAMPGQDVELMDDSSDTTEVLSESKWKPDEEDDDPLGLYGLRLEFLKSLKITPPLDQWVHVTNFRCDKHELRDVLELAGRVLSCSVVHITKKYAKVQYSHPLEAVQAISMFNGQMFYGQKLQVSMERNPNNDLLLPKGLANIGLGLGLLGRPIRDIEKQYGKYIENKKSFLNPVLFRQSNNEDDGLLSYNKFMASADEKSFKVKHAFELDTVGSGLSDTFKMNGSSDSNSVKSANSPGSTNNDKDLDKSLEFQKTLVPTSLLQPEVPGSTNPIRQSANEPCLNRIPTLSARPHVIPSTSFRPGPPGPQFQGPVQYPIRPGPSNIHQSMPNPSNSNPLAYSQPFKPQMPSVRPGPINRPEPVREPGPGFGTGPIQGPGPVQGPGQIRGPGFNPAPGQNQANLGPGPVQRPISGQAAGPVFGPGYGHGPAPNSMSTPGPMGNSRVTVQLSNLPPSTTFPLLCEKLSHCGQVVSLQLTTPGCAVVTFSHLSYGQKCFQTYNGLTVEGYTITVTFL